MKSTLSTSDIVHTTLSQEDIIAGVNYGIISRAWTYDRMKAQREGNYGKAIFRIAAGRAVQHSLERWLSKYNVTLQGDETDYKQTDHWDLRSANGKRIDIKGAHFFTNFDVPGRPPLSPSLIASSSNGDDWASFFPMLIPQDQFNKNPKEFYVFYLLASPSSQRVPYISKDPQLLITLPFARNDKPLNQLYEQIHTSHYANRRVALGDTFALELKAHKSSPLSIAQVSIGYGSAKGEATRTQVDLAREDRTVIDGLTALHYVRLRNGALLSNSRYKNDYLFKVTFKRVIPGGDVKWEIAARDFEDVWIYNNNLYFIGWITAEEFHRSHIQYPAWSAKPDESHNIKLLSGLPGTAEEGTYCYFYPPSFGRQYRGGTKNFNYYSLPQDLHPMNKLATFLNMK